jgi:hypothetical protein
VQHQINVGSDISFPEVISLIVLGREPVIGSRPFFKTERIKSSMMGVTDDQSTFRFAILDV